MKRISAASLLFLLVVQLCLFPAVAEGAMCPSVSTLPATNIGSTTATLNGSVDFHLASLPTTQNGIILTSSQYALIDGIQVYVSFKYGTKANVYDHETPTVLASGPGNFQVIIQNLPPCTTHYARAKIHTVIGLVKFDGYQNILQGAGTGIDPYRLQQFVEDGDGCPDTYGDEISFDTIGCQTYIGTGSHGAGGITGFGTAPPGNPPIVLVNSAAVAATRVSPGEKVDVSATITNKGGSSGTSKVTLFINGQEVESKGITLSSGESTTMHFSVSRNDPGTYTAYVNSIPAGSFTVDQFKNNDALIYGVIALFIIGIAGIVFLLVRKKTI